MLLYNLLQKTVVGTRMITPEVEAHATIKTRETLCAGETENVGIMDIAKVTMAVFQNNYGSGNPLKLSVDTSKTQLLKELKNALPLTLTVKDLSP